MLGELFEPGNIDSIYSKEVEKGTKTQAARIFTKVSASLVKAAAENKPLPKSTEVEEAFIYNGNLEDLHGRGVSVFRVEYTWNDPCLVIKFSRKTVIHFLVWDKDLADDFDDMVLTPYFNSRSQVAKVDSYKYSVVTP